MLGRARILLTIATCALATSAAAQVPAPTTAFDGTYAGVSRTVVGVLETGYSARECLPNSEPPPLTIVNGVAQTKDSAGVTLDGTVNAQGVLVMRSSFGTRVDAQIDDHGTVRGRMNVYCSYQMVWQKNGK
jgi:hypothetical protein